VKRFRPSGRRLLSFAAAAAAGAAATLFVATPAFAHHVNTKGVGSCDPAGGWNVTWTVESGGTWKPYYKILTASSTPPGGSIGGDLGSLATSYKPVNQAFTGTQHFNASVASATLTATALFSTSSSADVNTQGAGTEVKIAVDRPACSSVPVVTFKDNCDGTVTVTLDNQQGSAPVTFTITGSPDKTVNGGQKLDVTVPGNNGQIVVHTQGKDDSTHTWHPPTEQCPNTSTPSPSPSLPTTGSSLSTPLTLGGVLLAAGIGLVALVFAMRRRRSLAG
jgi:LPXTG-motif cell wall-anchored protein